MGTLRREGGEEPIELGARHLVGRSSSCDLRVACAQASSVHAELRWTEQGWVVRDLGSRNGTWADGRRLDPGVPQPLITGSILAFGHPDARWVFAADRAPVARAIPAGGGPAVLAEGGLLTLPDGDEPEVSVYLDTSGRWWVDGLDGSGPLSGETVEAGGETWRLELPAPDPGTPALALPEVGSLVLHFAVSPDEEYVELVARHPDGEVDLGARAHHYLLLLLARLWSSDRTDPEKDPTTWGWVHTSELMRMMRVPERQLNLQICRARKQLAQAGIPDAAALLQRRRGTGQLRLGVAGVRFAAL